MAQNALTIHFIKLQSPKTDGEATLIQTPSGITVMIDSGSTDEWSQLIKYLKRAKIKKIDILVSSHAHADHIGNHAQIITALMKNGKKLILDSGYPRNTAKLKFYRDYLKAACKHHFKLAKAGEKPKWDPKIKVEVLNPAEKGPVTNPCTYQGTQDTSGKKIDNNSLIVKIIYQKHSFLFTGELLTAGEERLIAKYGKSLRGTVLKLAEHGGSKDSNGQKFLSYVKPTYAVAMAGNPSPYNHPTTVLRNRLNQIGTKLYWTGKDGNVIMTTNGSKLKVTLRP